MSKIIGLVLTTIAGLFFLLGGLISLKVTDKNKLNHFSIALSFIIMLSLIFFDLGPESYELLSKDYDLFHTLSIILTSVLIGFFLLKMLDLFVPTHHHEHHEHEKNIAEHNSHLSHIGTLTIISLIIHNFLEGFAIYGLGITSFKLGILTCLSIGLHNIPLGAQIFSSLNIKKNKLLVSFLILSSLIGGLICLIVGNISNVLLAVITSITLGMLIYIALLELLPELTTNIEKKETRIGLSVGIILLIISAFI